MSGVDKFEKYLRASEGAVVAGSGKVQVGGAIVSIAGSGRYIPGEMLTAAGSVSVSGDIAVRSLRVSGSAKVRGSVNADVVSIAGGAAISGDVKVRILKISGGVSINGCVRADTAKLYGGVKLSRGEFGTLKVYGSIAAESISAEKVEIVLDGNSRVRTIRAGILRVKRQKKKGALTALLRVFSKKTGFLEVDTIEADDVDIDYTACKKLRGGSVRVGPHCRVDLVEYRTSLIVAKGATIGKVICVGGNEANDTQSENA